MLTPLFLTPSFGFGDRLGLATLGHIAAVRGTGFAPIFAQQSVRENLRTGRSPQQVLDDARQAVEVTGWDAPWGADADHLKTVADLPPFVDAGYTFFTVDPGEHVDNAADTDPESVLCVKVKRLNWEEISAVYLSQEDKGFGVFDTENLRRALVKYGWAIRHTVEMYHRLTQLKAVFDFEISVDETDTPTTPLEHFFIANELTRAGVKFTSLAPRFIGRFEKGVDYIGDLTRLDMEMKRHAAVTAHFGTYKISLHSGSDKFSVYPLLVKHWGKHIHVKTAGTSYLEALRTIAVIDPALFEEIYMFARRHYEEDRKSYHISAELARAPMPEAVHDWSSLFDQFDVRQILHVTFGSVLTDRTVAGDRRFYHRIMDILRCNPAAYAGNLEKHFSRHLSLLRP